MDYEKKYNEALERAKELIAKWIGKNKDFYIEDYSYIFPELRESEDERIRAVILKLVLGMRDEIFTTADKLVTKPKVLDWLKKQKEQKSKDDEQKWLDGIKRDWFERGKKEVLTVPELYGLEKQKEQKPILEVFGFKVGDAVRLKDGDGRKHIIKSFEEVEGIHGPNFYHVEFEDNSARDGIYPGEEYPNGYYTQMEKFKEEQRPASTEDMPYITDEHFYEREPADSFRYKLAEYMTKNSRKEETPDGYTYHISAETILKMAEEELLKRGVVQKPAEWSEEDENCIRNLESVIYYDKNLPTDTRIKLGDFLKSLRPHWKPSEEQMNALNFAITYFMHETSYKNPTELRDLYEQLKKL